MTIATASVSATAYTPLTKGGTEAVIIISNWGTEVMELIFATSLPAAATKGLLLPPTSTSCISGLGTTEIAYLISRHGAATVTFDYRTTGIMSLGEFNL